MSTASDGAYSSATASHGQRPWTVQFRMLGWISVALTFAYTINNFLSFWLDWPGVLAFLSGVGVVSDSAAKPAEGAAFTLGALQFLVYVIAVALAAGFAARTPDRSLRDDSARMIAIVNYIIRAAFWAVLLIGLADAVISFMRVENLLEVTVGADLATELGRSRFRGPFVHTPLLILSLLIAARSRTLGFHWLALLVVASELFIVLTRFVFSYEQAFQGDLVRFWYGALFLFASAYTLFEDGHVRVDVVYAGLSEETKGLINAIGCVLLGITMCWTIMIFGMWSKSSIINSALLAYEVSQSGFGMYVKYWMAGFLAIFAVTMNIQFTGYALESIADYRSEPGKRTKAESSGH